MFESFTSSWPSPKRKLSATQLTDSSTMPNLSGGKVSKMESHSEGSAEARLAMAAANWESNRGPRVVVTSAVGSINISCTSSVHSARCIATSCVAGRRDEYAQDVHV